MNLIFRFIYIAREEFGQSTWDKVSYFKEHMKEHHGEYNEEAMWTYGNSLGTRREHIGNKEKHEIPPPQPQNKQKWHTWMHV